MMQTKMKRRMKTKSSISDVVNFLQTRQRLILLSHEKPDGDSLGSLFGFYHCLKEMKKDVILYVTKPLPQKYRHLISDPPPFHPSALAKADGIVCLDVTEWERVDRPREMQRRPALPLCVIDHHPDNMLFGDVNWVDSKAAATAEMLSRLLRKCACKLSPAAASCLLTGLVMDTGGFRFANTTKSVFHEVEFLLKQGAEYQKVMHELFMREPYQRLLLRAHILQTARFKYDGQLVYALLDRELMEKLQVHVSDTEGLIDVLKTIENVKIACLLREEESLIRVSLRSRDENYPVNSLAHKIGGGGHKLAAGATLEHFTLEQAELKLLDLTKLYFGS